MGTFYNCLGDTNALVRRDSFFALGGFTEDFGHNHEDKELFTRAVLRGYRLEVIPEALYWYRENPQGINLSSDPYLNNMRGLRPYREVLPPSMEHLLNFALAHYLHANHFSQRHSAMRACFPGCVAATVPDCRPRQSADQAFLVGSPGGPILDRRSGRVQARGEATAQGNAAVLDGGSGPGPRHPGAFPRVERASPAAPF